MLARSERERRIDAPEFVPIDHDRHPLRGFDARSALVLALVVAALAGIVGWATTIGDSGAEAPTPAAGADDADADAGTTVAEDAAAEGAAGTATDDSPALVAGTDLAIGRVIPARGASGAGLVAVGVGNRGDVAWNGRGDATVLVVVDGEVAASEQLPAIDAGASTRVTVPLDSCPSGTVSITAVIDPGAVVREADERNNATSRAATFGC